MDYMEEINYKGFGRRVEGIVDKEVTMKKVMMVLVLFVMVTGCTKSPSITEDEIHKHSESVSDHNVIEGQRYSNDFLGMRVELPEDITIYDYDALNLSSMPTNRNLLIMASGNNGESLIMVEMLNDGSDYRKEIIEDIETENEKDDVQVEYEELETTIGGREAYHVKMTETIQAIQTITVDYYTIEQNDVIISIVLSYDGENASSVSSELLEGIEFY